MGQVVKCLVAEQQVYARVWNIQLRNIALPEFNGKSFLRCLCARVLKSFSIRVDSDELLGREMLSQKTEGLTLAASGVKDNWIRRLPFWNNGSRSLSATSTTWRAQVSVPRNQKPIGVSGMKVVTPSD